jgi:hypothetical protein
MASIILLYSTNSINLVIKPQEYAEDIQGSFMNIGFIFIEWYENKYFKSGSSHEWIMIIFIPQAENKFCIYRKKTRIFCLL